MKPEPSAPVLVWLDRHFSVRLPFARFARNTLALSVTGLAPVLVLYLSLVPGLWGHLLDSDAALLRFVRQIVTNGLPVVFAVNAFGLILFAQLRARRLSSLRVLAIDIPTRIGSFVTLHAVIYAASARLFGAFGGDAMQGLRVVGPTLAQAAVFGNLSGVYLYATLISALPLHMALIGAGASSLGLRPPAIPVLVMLALAVFGLQALLLTALALLMSA
jgi:hypothetical protein